MMMWNQVNVVGFVNGWHNMDHTFIMSLPNKSILVDFVSIETTWKRSFSCLEQPPAGLPARYHIRVPRVCSPHH